MLKDTVTGDALFSLARSTAFPRRQVRLRVYNEHFPLTSFQSNTKAKLAIQLVKEIEKKKTHTVRSVGTIIYANIKIILGMKDSIFTKNTNPHFDCFSR